jgi:hypothetical protein
MKEMRFLPGLIVAFASILAAQTGTDPEVAKARAALDRLRALVEAGAAPRAELERAQDALSDAEDDATLRSQLTNKDMDQAQADDVLAAAKRRMDRREKRLAGVQKLVNLGAASRFELGTFQEEANFARGQYDLALERQKLTTELAEIAAQEEELARSLAEQPAEAAKIAERFDGNGLFTPAEFERLEAAFETHFHKALPVSAMGQTAVHRALGFDHRNRVDVAIHPDQPEGIWLREFLAGNRIPYFAFRQAVPGKATGAHIHIGPISTRLAHGG